MVKALVANSAKHAKSDVIEESLHVAGKPCPSICLSVDALSLTFV